MNGNGKFHTVFILVNRLTGEEIYLFLFITSSELTSIKTLPTVTKGIYACKN